MYLRCTNDESRKAAAAQSVTWIKELTSQEIMEIHDRIIERYGGTKGILYQGTVDHIVYSK